MKVDPHYFSLALVVAAGVLAGCQPYDEPSPTFQNRMPGLSMHGYVPNGEMPNGEMPNGEMPNGEMPNGEMPNGVLLGTLVMVSDPGLTDIHLQGAELVAKRADQSEIRGTELIGATMSGTFPNGSPADLRIDLIESTADPEIFHYTVSFSKLIGQTVHWLPLCGTHEGQPIKAFPLQGWWDYRQGHSKGGSHTNDLTRFTFACKGFALAKCTESGYRPWESIEECLEPGVCQPRALRTFHQACTRSLLADYCGDGTAHTVAGTTINLWDHHGIQNQEQTPWTLEAEWTADRAACIRHVRGTEAGAAGAQAALDYIAEHCNNVPVDPENVACGGSESTFFTANGYSTPLAQRVLLRNESPTPPEPEGGSSSSSGSSGSSSSGQ